MYERTCERVRERISLFSLLSFQLYHICMAAFYKHPVTLTHTRIVAVVVAVGHTAFQI